MRSQIRRIFSQSLRRRAEVAPDAVRRAIVFAPHPDDETLGCGGTIARRLRQSVQVSVVVMTDGRVSHGHLMDADELAALRAGEVRAACATLGVAGPDLLLLGFTDGQLAARQPEAVERVAAILRERQPDEVFVPHQGDSPADHRATLAIVCAALRRVGRPAFVNEYPVWYWYHWPWVGLPLPPRRATLAVLKRTLAAGMGLRLARELNYAVPIDDLLAIKRAALEQHASQMTRLRPDSGWATLGDVAGGEWLACFFGVHEPFRRSVYRGAP